MNLITRFLLLSFVAACVAACDREPECDSERAEELMADTVYTLMKNALRHSGESTVDARDPTLAAVGTSSRHEAITDMYFPHLAIAQDRKWLQPRISARIPETLKHVELPVYLMMRDFEAIRRAVKVRLASYERVPKRTQDGRTYSKVCRATVFIEPTINSIRESDAITLTFSLNPTPRSNRESSASPIYAAINFFDATEAPLSFPLSDDEKIALMTMGATKDIQAQPKPQEPTLRLTKRALRAFRRYFESIEASSDEALKPAL